MTAVATKPKMNIGPKVVTGLDHNDEPMTRTIEHDAVLPPSSDNEYVRLELREVGLTERGEKRLNELEAKIDDGKREIIAQYVSVGRALLDIETEKLVVHRFTSTAEYAAARFGFEAPMTSKLMNAARVVNALETKQCKRLPDNEGQTRELWPALKPESGTRDERDAELLRVWNECLKREKEGQKITAAMIRSVRDGVEETTKAPPTVKLPSEVIKPLPTIAGSQFSASISFFGTDDNAKALAAVLPGSEQNGGDGKFEFIAGTNDRETLLDTIGNWIGPVPGRVVIVLDPAKT